jgi:hypothetical protein
MSDEEGAAATGGALMEVEDQSHLGLDQRQPVMDRINPRMLELLRKSRMGNLNGAETGMALELAVQYRLDPFAGEIWATKSQGRDGAEGKLLIMVGRDGLRKVVTRNGLQMDGDVVREKDEFRVTRRGDRTRLVEHSWEGSAEDRGAIVGAWAEVWDADGNQRGFFFAPLDEYKPTNAKKLQYSPWGSQLSVMILAAAERQAARQATPLSGLLVEGEMDLNEERAAGNAAEADDATIQAIIDSLDASEELRDELYEAVKAANETAPGSWYPGKLQVQLAGRSEEQLREDVAYIRREAEELAERRARAAETAEEPGKEGNIQDAQVVPEEEPGEAPPTGEHRINEDDELEMLRSTIVDLEAALDDAEEGLERDELQEKLKRAEKRRAELEGE